MTRHVLIGAAALASTALVSLAQAPRVRHINFYGLQKISPERILHDIKLQSGDPLPASSGDLQERISRISGIVAARVEAVCCEGPDAILFIGIDERGGPHVAFHSEPAGEITLPSDLVAAYHDYAAAMQRAAPTPVDVNSFQEQFRKFAAGHLEQINQAVRSAAEPEQRAIAATVLGFAPRKQGPIDDLECALQDADDRVRTNALESLRIFAALAVRRPDLGLKISATWPIELLNSLVLSDRVQATDLLITLTDKGNHAVLQQIRDRGVPALVEMARWETLRYALPPFLLVGRIAGLPEQEIQRRWSNGEREPVIQRALGHSESKR